MPNEIENTQVIIGLGGYGKRMGLDIPKALVKLGESTLLDRSIKMLTDCGFHNFIFLLSHGDTQVTEHIEKSKWKKEISVTMLHDPAPGMGVGKAITHAIKTGKIDVKKRSLIIWPDQAYFDARLPEKALAEHLKAVKKFRIIVSVVVETGHRYPYGVAKVNKDSVMTDFEEKPMVQLLTNMGLFILEPDVYKYFIEMIDLDAKGPLEFETTVLPRLAKEGKAYAIQNPPESWIAINTLKELEQAQKLIDSGVISRL